MKLCFDQEVENEVADRCREWLESEYGRLFWKYIETEAVRHHDMVASELTGNPINDILSQQRETGAEKALLHLLNKVQDEILEDKSS